MRISDWSSDVCSSDLFAEPKHSVAVARFFLDELARNGTTTAAVYGTVHAGAAEAFFAEAHHRNARMIAGKVLMDRNAPAPLMDTAATGYDESKALIERWHGHGRVGRASCGEGVVQSV